MAHIATFLLLLPLLGYVLVLLLGNTLKEKAIGAVATGVVAISFILTVITFVLLLHRSSSRGSLRSFTCTRRPTCTASATIASSSCT
jgi:NADH:ubiquinone oxidoreductase subunit 5 (subunit L)/multisubunit Na+/H+ antiporter MnhA subunit